MELKGTMKFHSRDRLFEVNMNAKLLSPEIKEQCHTVVARGMQ